MACGETTSSAEPMRATARMRGHFLVLEICILALAQDGEPLIHPIVMRFLLAASLIVSIACRNAEAQSIPEKLRLAYSAIGGSQASVWIPHEAGIFKKNGLDVELLYVGGGGPAAQVVQSGEVPIDGGDRSAGRQRASGAGDRFLFFPGIGAGRLYPTPLEMKQVPRRRMLTTQAWFHWALLSAAFALTAIFAKVGLEGVDSDYATLIRTCIIFIAIACFVYATDKWTSPFALHTKTWSFLTLSGLATGASRVCYFRALQMGDASKVAPIDKLSVVLVAIFAVVFLQERPAVKDWLGIGFVAVGVVLLGLKR